MTPDEAYLWACAKYGATVKSGRYVVRDPLVFPPGSVLNCASGVVITYDGKELQGE